MKKLKQKINKQEKKECTQKEIATRFNSSVYIWRLLKSFEPLRMKLNCKYIVKIV